MSGAGHEIINQAAKITVLGSGTWGIALARILSMNGHSVTVWSKFPEEAEKLDKTREAPNLPGIRIPKDILFISDPEAAAAEAEYLMMVVPSIYVRETAALFTPYLQNHPVWINASKGIESATLMTLTEVIEDEIVKHGGQKPQTVAISGPTHAEEVARDLPTLIVAAGDNADITQKVQKLFEGSCIRPYTNEDKRGVQICGALKNVEALAVGIAKGLGYGDNTRAAMITRGMEEIRRLGLAMGCNERTFFGLAGIGDLIVTATSNHSRNNRAGMLIGEGKTPEEALKEVGMVVEGVNALPAAIRLCEKYGMDMPLIHAVREVIRDGADPKEIVQNLMGRELKKENV